MALFFIIAPGRSEVLPQHALVEKKVDINLLKESSSVDVIYAAGTLSHAEYQKKTVVPPSSEAATPRHIITRPSLTPFGSCRTVSGKLQRTGSGHCGVVLSLASSAPLNLAAMELLEIEGVFSGSWQLAIADLPRQLADENLPTGISIGQQGATLDLASIARTIDLTRVMSLVFLLDSPEGSAAVEQLRFSRTLRSPPRPQPPGVWIWNNRLVSGHEEDVVQRLAARGIGRVYLQVDDDPGRFLPFVESAKKQNIEVFALDGDPGYVQNPEPLVRRLKKVAALANTASGATFAGFQVDIEPYLNKDFALRREYYSAAYLDLLYRLKKEGALSLSVVVPFWFDTLYLRGTTLLQKVIEVADELVVMSYRTNSAELLAIARTELGLGEKLAKPVRLGIELGRIVDERHIELEPASGQSNIRLGGMWWKKKADYNVSGDRISFYNRTGDLPGYMATAIPFSSFGGWVIHSYEELGEIRK